MKEGTITGRNADGFTVKAGDDVYTGKKLLIATGSVPVVPLFQVSRKVLNQDLSSQTEILDLTEVPKELCIVGGES